MDHGLIFTIDLIIENFQVLPKKIDHYSNKNHSLPNYFFNCQIEFFWLAQDYDNQKLF